MFQDAATILVPIGRIIAADNQFQDNWQAHRAERGVHNARSLAKMLYAVLDIQEALDNSKLSVSEGLSGPLVTDFLLCQVIMLTHRPRAVIFDLDGLILDSEIIYRKAWKQAAEELGYCMNDEQYLRFLGRRDVECEMILVETYGSRFPLTDFLMRSDTLSREHLKKHGITLKPGVHELLNLLDARSVRKAIATSTERSNVLSSLGGLADRFNVIVTGEDITAGKPAPDILILCSRLLKVQPQHCVVLEDSEVGVQAAHAAGMPVVIVPDLNQPSPQSAANAAAVCDSLHAVTESLRKLWTPIVQ